MGTELTGIVPGGAKVKVDLASDHAVFRAAIKAEVPYDEITAEARGTLLVLSFRGQTAEFAAGAKAGALAAKIRSPPSRLDKMGVEFGMSAAVAGPVDVAFKQELSSRTVVASGLPKQPVDLLILGVEAAAQLDTLPRLIPLIADGGALWVIYPKGVQVVTEKLVLAAGRSAGLKDVLVVRFSGTHTGLRFVRPTTP